jgi:asparagine synthase (glutamine-hydrolysing)
MCGIAGIVHLDGQPPDAAQLGLMNQVLAHRGPDSDGVHCRGNVGLAHRRLAIIDPRTGRQPFLSDDGAIALTYNGEVYNYRELRDELVHEFPFSTQSDTEVLLRAYQKWGLDCLQRLRGMFAFALHDAAAHMLYLVRDRVGIKPLYYCRFGSRLAFASELAALLKLPWVRREIDPQALSDYFKYSYVPTPASIYRNVHKLEPGQLLSVDLRSGEIEKTRYWELPVGPVQRRSERAALEELDALLDDTVGIYVRSDVDFGCFLSGGVDSSLIAAVMSRRLGMPVETFSIGFPEAGHSELPFAAQASGILGTRHHEKVVTALPAADLAFRLASHFGEPFADSSAIPTYYVAREAASRVKMVLSGDGGDELFAGYDSYPITWRDMRDPLQSTKTLLYGMLARVAPFRRVRRAAYRRSLNPREKHNAQRHIFTHADLKALMPETPLRESASDWPNSASQIDTVTRFQAEDFRTYLPDDVLTKVDRMSMANSLEVRVPLLDHKVVEFAFSLPLDLKIREEAGRVETKYLLKRSAARFFPGDFLSRPKHGFGIPLVEWCQGPLLPVIQQRLLNPAGPMAGWISMPFVQQLVSEFAGGAAVHTAKIWSLLMFDAWLSEVHDR